MEIIKNYIHIGVKEPFCVLHASDTHLAFADGRETARKLELAQKRQKEMHGAEADLRFLRDKAIEEQRTVIYTGDLIDFVSQLNYERAEQFTNSVDVFMSAGNHEFSHYLGEAKEDAAYRNRSLAAVQRIFKNDIRCSSRIIGGVNFVAVDNSYYLIEKQQLDFIRMQCEKEFPVILAVHVPLYTKEFYDFTKSGEQSPANLMSVPEELMHGYSQHRYEQQKQDEITAQAYSFIIGCSNIKAILSGHIHENFEGTVNGNIYQIATGRSTVREIYID